MWQTVQQNLPVLPAYTLTSLPQFLHLAIGTLVIPLLKVSEGFILRLCGNSIPNLLATFLILDPEQPYSLPISS